MITQSYSFRKEQCVQETGGREGRVGTPARASLDTHKLLWPVGGIHMLNWPVPQQHTGWEHFVSIWTVSHFFLSEQSRIKPPKKIYCFQSGWRGGSIVERINEWWWGVVCIAALCHSWKVLMKLLVIFSGEFPFTLPKNVCRSSSRVTRMATHMSQKGGGNQRTRHVPLSLCHITKLNMLRLCK